MSIIEHYNVIKSTFAPIIKRNICCINGKLVLATNKILVELDLHKLIENDDDWKSFL